jgi:GAF domain-containing protein
VRAVEQTSHRLTELSRRHLGEYALGVPLELSQVLALVPRLSANALRARTAILRLVDEATGAFDQVFRFEQAPSAELVVAEESLAALTRQETVPILIPDLSQDARFAPQVPARPISALAVPLLQRDTFLGTLCLLDKIAATPGEPAAFEERDVNLLLSLATEAGIAIENARLFQAASQHAAELAALREVGQAITGQLKLSSVLEAIVTGTTRLLDSQYSQVLLWDETTQQLRYGAALGPEAERVRVQVFAEGRGVNAAVARTREAVLLDDYQASPYALPDFPDVVATITTPVLFSDRLLGILHSHTTQPGKRFTAADLRLLRMLATQAAIAIENARLFEEAQVRSARFRALSELSRKVTASLDSQQVFDYAVRAAVDLLDLALARLWGWQEATGLLHVSASAGDPDLLPPARETFAPGEGVTGAVFQTSEVAILDDAGNDPRYREHAWAHARGVRNVAVVPVRLGERAVGVLSVARRTGRPFRADDLELLTSFAQHVAIAVENARLFREKERLAVEELLRLRKLAILSEIGAAMQGTMQVDALLRIVLSGVTYGGGLGFNRAMLLLVDDARRLLVGRLGVGPASGEEAAAIWGALTAQHRPLAELIAERAKLGDDRDPSPFDRLTRSLRIPLHDSESLLARSVREARSFRAINARGESSGRPVWERQLDVDEFACAPLMAKGKVIGVLVVDNKFNAKPITDEDLEFLSAFATQAGLAVENARVYSSLEDANREIQRSHHRLLHQERLAALGEMAAHVVHEIRNPLVAIGGFARRLAQRLAGREPEGQYAQIIAREADRLERIARDVRGLSRELRLSLAETDLHAVIQECLVLFAERIALQRVAVRTDLAEGFPVLRLDSVQMKQTVLNLLINALEAMPSGGALTLATRVVEAVQGHPTGRQEDSGHGSQDGGLAVVPPPTRWATLSVGDTGGGIPTEILGEVFNPFFTTKEVGTGLGLTLVRRITRAHGGRVEVDNRPGDGVTFCLWLPVEAPTGSA